MINIVIWFIVLLILGIYGASIYTFFKTLCPVPGTFIQFREGDLWLKKWEERLRIKGVKIHFNGKLNSFHEKNGWMIIILQQTEEKQLKTFL